ncbi:MAG: BolA family transcriptional regulator [Pseudomonadota bacterium]
MNTALASEVSALLEARFPNAEISVEIDGNRAQVRVRAAELAELSRVKRQQAVYGVIGRYVTDGTLHAVTIDAQPLA